LTKDIALQISKDAELVGSGQIRGATWHFFQSPVTGLGGPSGPLLQALEEAGIGVVIH
jgi:filamentous hemagglutinin